MQTHAVLQVATPRIGAFGAPSGTEPAEPKPAEQPPALRAGRLHEALGPAARAFAAAQAGARRGPVVWILPPGARERPDGFGAARLFDPGRLLLVEAKAPIDVFWAAEEALRSGAAPLVIAETTEAPGLTRSRRLQLAAEAGGAVGLVLPPDRAQTATSAAETRWRTAPALSTALDPSGSITASAPSASRGLADGCARSALGWAPAWRWRLVKHKRGPIGAWIVRWLDGARAEAGEDGLEAPWRVERDRVPAPSSRSGRGE